MSSRNPGSTPPVPATTAVAAPAAVPESSAKATVDSDDQALVQQISQQNPDVTSAYENSLKEVNAYLADATEAVRDNPDDPAAHEQLKDAYEQKAMLYEMATTRSLE